MKYRGLELDRFQEVAISHLMEGRSVLVSAPTGTGKTIIADWIVEEALQTGRDVVYTAPVKALSNQKFRDWTRLYGESKVGLITGDLVIRREAPCRVMTTEILRNMLLAGERLDHLLAVILDEIHFLDDRERGTVWEEVLIYLPARVQIVGLSATLSNLAELAKWMTHVRGAPVEVVEEHRRAVPLTFHIASIDTGLVPFNEFEAEFRKKRARIPEVEPRFPRGGGKKQGRERDRGHARRPDRPSFRTRHVDAIRLARDHEMLPLLYFSFSRKDCERYARDLSGLVRDGFLDAEQRGEMDRRLRAASVALGPALDHDIRQLYLKGIAFHHAGLHVQLKALVEELYENRLLKVLYCTSTFALGINLPARTVVFDALEKFDGRQTMPLTTRQFMQKAGRAGRRGLDESGFVVIRMDLEEWERRKPQLERYKRGAYEPVRSSFNLSWNSVINLLDKHDEAHIRAVVGKSFLAWHLAHEAEVHEERADALDKQVGDGNSHAVKEARRLRKRAARAEDRVWEEFQRKVRFLIDTGYLAEDGSFNAGARVLKNLQIAEIPVAELVLSGILEDLDPPTLFGVLCALTNELGRNVQRNFSPRRDDKRLAHDIESLVRSGMVAQAAEIAGMPWTWDPDLLPIGRAWAEGKSLQELLMMIESATDVSGDLITGFRRAKDLCSQLEDVYVDIPERRAMIHGLIRTVSRDEVEVVD